MLIRSYLKFILSFCGLNLTKESTIDLYLVHGQCMQKMYHLLTFWQEILYWVQHETQNFKMCSYK